jgi:hypothetical protein
MSWETFSTGAHFSPQSNLRGLAFGVQNIYRNRGWKSFSLGEKAPFFGRFAEALESRQCEAVGEKNRALPWDAEHTSAGTIIT